MKARIEKIIEASFQRIKEAHNGNSNGGIIFPNYTHGKKAGEITVSEQELKCAFIEELREKEPNWFYSVETPTDKKYRFKEKENICVNEAIGQSAQFDLTIYNENHALVAQIEFKAHASTTLAQYEKDFLTLAEVNKYEKVYKYFIQIFHHFGGVSEKSVDSKLAACKEKIEGVANVHYRYCILDGSGKIGW